MSTAGRKKQNGLPLADGHFGLLAENVGGAAIYSPSALHAANNNAQSTPALNPPAATRFRRRSKPHSAALHARETSAMSLRPTSVKMRNEAQRVGLRRPRRN